MPSKPIGDLLNTKDNGELGRLLKRSSDIGQLTSALADALPGDLGASLVSASVSEDGTLNLKTTSSAWASRLRFEAERLLEASRAAGKPARTVNVRVGRPNRES